MEDKICLAIFGSTNKVLKAEKIFKENGIPFKLLPTPKKLAKYCDIAISFSESRITDAKSILDKADVKVKGYYVKEGEDYAQV